MRYLLPLSALLLATLIPTTAGAKHLRHHQHRRSEHPRQQTHVHLKPTRHHPVRQRTALHSSHPMPVKHSSHPMPVKQPEGRPAQPWGERPPISFPMPRVREPGTR